MTAVTCHGITRSGERCCARRLAGSTYCVNHSPAVNDEQRKVWAAKGGRNSSARSRARKALPAEIMTVDEVASWLGVVYKDVISGKIAPPVATAAANVARTMVALKEATETEERLDALEQAVGAQGTPMRRFGA